MPPIQQQQTSRAGLITSLVITIMIALGLLIWGIMTNSEKQKALNEATKVRNESRQIYAEGDGLERLRQLKNDAAYASAPTVLDVSLRETQDIVKYIAGDAKGVKEARDAVTATKAKLTEAAAGTLKGVTIPTEPMVLTTVIDNLLAKIAADATAVDTAGKAVATEKQRADTEIAKKQKEVDEAKTAMAAAEAALAAEKTRATTDIDAKQKQVDEFSKQVDEAKKTLNDAQVAQQADAARLQQEIDKLGKENQNLKSLLARYRPNTKEAVVRNADAKITQLGDKGTVYIDLGYGDHVVPGLTFEVYGRMDGVPPLAAGTSSFDLPKGKASIEIISVGQNSSWCRVTTLAQGQSLQPGDLCANIVYDKNLKPLFYVYGSFDMDNNGVATPGEAEAIKALIQRWGGRVTDKLGPEVDYTVVGKEPVVPTYTPDELTNPVINERNEQAKRDAAAYNAVVTKAGELSIPTLNQNRFLYYTGYFDAAKK
ncbi:MAG TPA: hypothetical protein VEA69_01285 [Tepidisphaeraceae bacterium]|nr:hypothetical protein [Tepidisphaeraceae bacterium]